jgi:3-deoxy-D-manno-octulosonic-acid transferase
MLSENAIVQLPKSAASEELGKTLDHLLSNDALRQNIGQRASLVCDKNRGATEQTLKTLANLLETRKAAGESISFSELSVTAAK